MFVAPGAGAAIGTRQMFIDIPAVIAGAPVRRTTVLIAPILPGFALAGGDLVPVTPARLLDTRDGGGGPVPAGGIVDIPVAGRAGLPATNLAALSSTSPSSRRPGPGFLTVHPTGRGVPLASNLNYTAGQTPANHVIAAVGDGGRVSVYVATSAAHVDVDAYVSNDPDVIGVRVQGLYGQPMRWADTRGTGPIGPGELRRDHRRQLACRPATHRRHPQPHCHRTHHRHLHLRLPPRPAPTLGLEPQRRTRRDPGQPRPRPRRPRRAGTDLQRRRPRARTRRPRRLRPTPRRPRHHRRQALPHHSRKGLDTRTTPSGPLVAGQRTYWLDHAAMGTAHGIESYAAFVKITATEATDPTFVVVDPNYWAQRDAINTGTSTVNLGPGQTVPNLAFSRGFGWIVTGAGSVHTIADVQALIGR